MTFVPALFTQHTQLSATPALLHKLNEKSAPYGLSLSMAGLASLCECRTEALKNSGRVEFGEGVLGKLVAAFADSPYLFQEDYVETLARLQAMFYQYKTETMERFSDDALLHAMREAFNGFAGGSLEYLEETVLFDLARTAHGAAASPEEDVLDLSPEGPIIPEV